jgi:hypothetical protein
MLPSPRARELIAQSQFLHFTLLASWRTDIHRRPLLRWA